MKYRAKVKADAILTVWIHEDVCGNQEIEDVEDIDDMGDFEILEKY